MEVYNHRVAPYALVFRPFQPVTQKSAPQGAWGTLGRSFADLLRPKASAESQESQRGSASAPSSSNDLSAVPLDPSAVGTMIGMGIEETWAAAALRRCGGSDVIRAVEFCFSHDMAALAEEDKALEAASRVRTSLGLVCWLAGWMVCWLAGWMVGWLVGGWVD